MALKTVQLDHIPVSILQDSLASNVNGLLDSPLAGAQLLKGVKLAIGTNALPHRLGQQPQGYAVIKQHGTLPQSDWQTMTLTAPFVALGGSWPVPAWRVTQGGKVECRGVYAAASAPTVAGQTFWVYPSAALAPSGATASAGRLFATPATFNASAWSAMIRMDAYSAGLNWFASGSSQIFGVQGAVAAVTSVTSGGLDGISWDLASGPALISDVQDINPTPDRTLLLTSSTSVTVDLLVF